MSRVGKQPIIIPAGVKVNLTDDEIIVQGPKGELTQKINKLVKVKQQDDRLLVTVKDEQDKKQRSLWGLFNRLLNNMMVGVTANFSRQLEINGVGYKAAVQGSKLVVNIGYSNPVEYNIPKNINIKVEKNLVTITGADKQQVGQVAAEIRSIRKPEPYKGKGIKYLEEVIRRKSGKSVAKGGTT